MLASKRLHFARLSREHLGRFHELVADGHIKEYLFDGETYSRRWCEHALAESDRTFAAQGVGLWMIAAADEPLSWLGFGGFWKFEHLGLDLQLLYALVAAATGQGYATEAACALIAYARNEAGFDKIIAAVDAPNKASIRVLEKVGFVPAGSLPGAFGETYTYQLQARE